MNRRLMLLALLCATFAAVWSADRSQLSDGERRELARLQQQQQRTPVAALVQSTGNSATARPADMAYVYWSVRMRRDTNPLGLASLAPQDDVWCSGLPRTDNPPDYWKFGCGRFEDGSYGSSHSIANVSQGASHALADRRVDLDGTPLPCGIVPGDYTVVRRDGSVSNITVTEQLLRHGGKSQRWPAGYYVHTDVHGTWHYFRVQRNAADSPLLVTDGGMRLLWNVCGHASQRVFGPIATLPLNAWLHETDRAADSSALGWLLEGLTAQWSDAMAQEIRHALGRIEWSSRLAERPMEYRY